MEKRSLHAGMGNAWAFCESRRDHRSLERRVSRRPWYKWRCNCVFVEEWCRSRLRPRSEYHTIDRAGKTPLPDNNSMLLSGDIWNHLEPSRDIWAILGNPEPTPHFVEPRDPTGQKQTEPSGLPGILEASSPIWSHLWESGAIWGSAGSSGVNSAPLDGCPRQLK